MRGLLLVDDPFELNNLLEGSLTPQAQAAYDGTSHRFERFLSSRLSFFNSRFIDLVDVDRIFGKD